MIWGAITAVGTLLLLVLKVVVYFFKKTGKKATYEEDRQKMENSIAHSNAADITAMFDDLRRPPAIEDHLGRQGSKETP